jgi:hypothetical protein
VTMNHMSSHGAGMSFGKPLMADYWDFLSKKTCWLDFVFLCCFNSDLLSAAISPSFLLCTPNIDHTASPSLVPVMHVLYLLLSALPLLLTSSPSTSVASPHTWGYSWTILTVLTEFLSTFTAHTYIFGTGSELAIFSLTLLLLFYRCRRVWFIRWDNIFVESGSTSILYYQHKKWFFFHPVLLSLFVSSTLRHRPCVFGLFHSLQHVVDWHIWPPQIMHRSTKRSPRIHRTCTTRKPHRLHFMLTNVVRFQCGTAVESIAGMLRLSDNLPPSLALFLNG